MLCSFPYPLQIHFLRTIGSISAVFLICFIFFFISPQLQWECAPLAFLAVLSAWRVWFLSPSQNIRQTGVFLACIYVADIFLIVKINTRCVIYCIYPVLILNNFLCSKTIALFLNSILIAFIPCFLDSFYSKPEQIFAIISLFVTLSFSHLIAQYCDAAVRRYSHQDGLDASMRLPNRRLLELALAEQIHLQDSHSQLNGLILIHIGSLSTINAHYGHRVSEAIVRDLVALLRKELRGLVQLFRFSNEEFVVLQRVEHQSDLSLLTERLHRFLLEKLRGPSGQCSIWLGSALYSNESQWQDWFARADAALFLAKRQSSSARVPCR